MKKRMMTAVLMAACVLAVSGCGKKEISNEYITISQYKGVEVEKVEAEKAKDEDITSYIDSVLEENRTEITDRALKEGDLAEFEYTGKLKGKVFDEGTLTLGSGETYVDGFEEGIYGHKIGETFKLPISLPEGYGGEDKPELSGADVVFTIKITSIKDGKLPELNDEFVKKVSKKSKTVEEYKKEVRAEIQKYYDEMARLGVIDNAWSAVLENVTVKKYPQERVDELLELMNQQLEMNLQYYGMTYEDYLKQNNMTDEEYKKEMEKEVKGYLKEVMTGELIAKEEGIKLSDKDYEKIMKEYVEQYEYDSIDALKADVGGEEELKKVIFQNTVKEKVAESCKQVEPKEDDKSEDKQEETEEK